MSHEHLVKWGKEAFERGLSLSHIENYLLRRGIKQHEALKALHEITSFEHKIRDEAGNIRKSLLGISIFLLLIISGLIFLYFNSAFK